MSDKFTDNQLFNLISGSRTSGESTYDVWKSLGNEGDANDFLEYLKSGASNVSEETLAQIEKNKNDISELSATITEKASKDELAEVEKKSVMLVTMTTGDSENFVVDKTFEEVYSHVANGGTAVLYDAVGVFPMTYLYCASADADNYVMFMNTLVDVSDFETYISYYPQGVFSYGIILSNDNTVSVKKSNFDLLTTEINALNTNSRTVTGAINEVNAKALTQSDWSVNDESDVAFIKNRPFYEENTNALICEHTCSGLGETDTRIVSGFGVYGDYEDSGWNIGYLPEAEYIFGDEYIVVINGVSYKSTLKKCYTDTNGWYAIGLGISEEDTFDSPKADGNVPFICYLSGIESPVEGVSYKGEMYFYLRQETETFPDTTIKIYHGETKIHHLDPKYIKDMYYTSDPVETTIVAETTFELQNGRGQLIAIQPLEVGQEYVITLDGTTYNFVAKFNEDTGVSYIGNLGLIGRGEDTGEMFFIAPMQSPIDLNFGIVINSDVVEHNLSIICNISEVHKIDEKYLPDSVLAKSDWNATENELGHILNRTHYTEKVLNDYIPETTLTFEFAPDGETRYSCFATGTADFEYPERFVDTFNVEFNNNTYDDLLAGHYTESGGTFGDGIGDTGMFGGIGFGQYPFLIGFYNAEEAAELGYNYIVYSKNSLTTATLRVARIETVVHQIDEKFIPETIARSSNSTMLVTVKMANTLAVDESYVADKTFSEIYDHIQNGGNAVVYNADMEMYLNFSAMEENSIIFTLNMITPNSQIINFAIARPDITQMSCNITSDGIITFNSSALIIPDIECSFLETEDKTIAGAINEVNSKFTDGVNAIILKSPNGTRFNITIGDDGVLKADEITA